MGLSKNITLTIKDYEIKLDKEIKFYENDTIDLCFSILEYGIEVKDGISINKLMPIQALTSYMLIETPQGVDYAESTKIEDNKIVFKLGSKYSQFVGMGHMQIVIKDSDGCRVTLPEFEFEIKKSINSDWERELYFLSTEDDSIIIDEFGRKIHMSKISDMPESENLSEESYAMIIDEEGNKRFKVKAIADAVEDSLDTKFNTYADEISGDVERIKGEVNEISESLEDMASDIEELKQGDIEIDLTDYAKKSDLEVKVDKVNGKSLILDSEITRLATVKNYDDTEIKNTLNNKANVSDLHSHTNKTVLDGITSAKVNEWNNKSTFDGNYNNLTNKPNIPTKVSELTNDSGYLNTHQDLSDYAKKSDLEVKVDKSYVDSAIEGVDVSSQLANYATKAELSSKVDKVIGKSLISDSEIERLATLENYDDSNIKNTLNSKADKSELHSHSNKSVLDGITSSKVTEWNNKSTFDGNYNNLTNKPTIPTKTSQLTNDSGYLTKHQDISHKADKTELHSHNNKSVIDEITSTKITEWNNKSNFSGSYNDLTNKPTIPTKTSNLINDSGFITTVPSEYVTETELNNKGYLTSIPSEYVTETELNTALEQFNPNSLQQVPLYANSIEECTDTTKCYVLPDGFIYAYKQTTIEVEPETPDGPLYTNMFEVDGYNLNKRWSYSSKKYTDANGHVSSGYIPVKAGDVVRIKLNNLKLSNIYGDYNRIHFFNSSDTYVAGNRDAGAGNLFAFTEEGNNTYSFTVGYANTTLGNNSTNQLIEGADDITKMVVIFNVAVITFNSKGKVLTDEDYKTANIIVTVNQEIKETDNTLPPEGNTQVVWQWGNTGHAFVPNENYDNLIADMKNITDEHSKDIVYLKAIVNSEDSTSGLSDSQKIARIKNWDMPIYENVPVFLLEQNKAGITQAELTNEKVYERYDTLMSSHSHYITRENCGMASDGTTPIYIYHFREPEPHINGGKGSEKKPIILVVSGVHPTERAGEYSMYYAMEEITTNPTLADLKRNVHFIIMPIINPTGVTDTTYGVRNPNGIQVHYNFEVDFKYPTDSGYVALGNRNHGGETPLSMPETQYFDKIMRDYQKDLAIVMSCHNNDVDTQRGTDFIWCSCPTNFATNIGYRLADKMSLAWRQKHDSAFDEGVIWANQYALQKASEGSSLFNPNYIKERPSWDWRVGKAGLSGSGGTEYKQALKYGVQGINVEICSRNMVLDKSFNMTLSSNAITWGCETYVNFFRIFMAVYDYKDKEQYYKK